MACALPSGCLVLDANITLNIASWYISHLGFVPYFMYSTGDNAIFIFSLAYVMILIHLHTSLKLHGKNNWIH